MSNSAVFKVDVNGIDNKLQDDEMATGDLKYWPGQTAPSGWFVRDGRALSRTAYAALFAVLGTTYGAGDGSTTFNIPDDRGEFIRGADMGRGVDAGRVLGSFQGADTAPVPLLTLRDDGYSAQMYQSGIVIKTGGVAGAVLTVENAGVPSTRFTGGGTETRPRNRAYIPLIKY